MSKEATPSAVPEAATQGGEVRGRWSWTEPTVWTERMLTALETGVKGGVWFSLMDKVFAEQNLRSSASKVAGNDGAPGVDHVCVGDFMKEIDRNVEKLIRELRAGTFRPQAIRRTYIPKPGTSEQRPLGIPTVRDRTVQGAIRHVIEPIFEKEFAEHSYGFRPGIGCKDALRRVDHLMKAGYVYVVDADLKSYFDTIPHERLMDRLRERIADGRVLSLIEAFLKAGILEDGDLREAEAGAPQGAVLSPLLSNIYLNPLDHFMVSQGLEMVRYADDFVILCRSQAEAEHALAVVSQWCAEAGLTLHPTKTRIVDVRTTCFEFLGYRIETDRNEKLRYWPRKSSLKKLKDRIRMKTKRAHGQSFQQIVYSVGLTLEGWFRYFKHSPRRAFQDLDAWIRMRLRSILRKRMGLRGRGRGADHQRWPNAFFFAVQGYFSLEAAHIKACQSPCG